MQINSINVSPNFGKTAIAKCNVKKVGSNEKMDATLYKMDPKNINDIDEIESLNNVSAIRHHFLKDAVNGKNYRNYYILQQNDTDEVVSCAQTSRHFSINPKYQGIYTSIDELGENSNYNDPLTPVIAHVANDASNKHDKNILTAFTHDEGPNLKKHKFSETKYENWVLPEKRYNTVSDMAEKRNQMEYLV